MIGSRRFFTRKSPSSRSVYRYLCSLGSCFGMGQRLTGDRTSSSSSLRRMAMSSFWTVPFNVPSVTSSRGFLLDCIVPRKLTALRYQEMIAHIPMASHPNPTDVLVVGGGDGGVIREVLKHKEVKKVTLVDIDEVGFRTLSPQ
jgi:NAD kinase